MNNQDQPKPQKRHRTQVMVALAFLLLVGVALFTWYRPRVFSFHANVSPISGNASGEVFASSGGVFLVMLNSGSQLTVQTNPPRVFLSPTASPSGFRIGNYLVVPAASVGGVDLSKSEGFNKQVPGIGDGKVTLKDPKQQDGSFSFPTGG
jgi:hypothetical protein